MDGATIEDADLMLDRRSIAGMCLLYTSMVKFTPGFLWPISDRRVEMAGKQDNADALYQCSSQ
jgi:hypothetical protein